MIHIPDELWEQWEKEDEEAKKNGAEFVTDEEFDEIMEGVWKEIDEELEQYDDSDVFDENVTDPLWEELHTGTAEERRQAWNRHFGDELYRMGPEDEIISE